MVDRPRADLGPLVAPFARPGSTAVLSIVDAAGRTIAGPASLAGAKTTQPVILGGIEVARVVASGPDAGHPLVESASLAIAAAIRAALEPEVRLERELAHARRLQRSFVSLETPDVPGYDIASHYEAAREVGGDFFDLFRLRRRDRPLSIVIADVTGKGIAAALLMAFARPLLHAAIDNTTTPTAALQRTNDILVSERRSSLFITILAGRLDIATGHLCLANAGHEPPLLIRADGSPPIWIQAAGPLVGLYPSIAVPEACADLGPGDLIILYTDGVTDARAPSGERFEERRLVTIVEGLRDAPAAIVVDAIRDGVAAFAGGAEPADDITIVAIRRHPAT